MWCGWAGGQSKTGNEERRQRPTSVFNFSSFRLFVRMCAAVEQNMALSFFWSIASSSSSSSSITTGVQLILPTKTAELGVRVCPNLCSYLLERALATSLALTWVCKFHLASHTSYDGGATSIDYIVVRLVPLLGPYSAAEHCRLTWPAMSIAWQAVASTYFFGGARVPTGECDGDHGVVQKTAHLHNSIVRLFFLSLLFAVALHEAGFCPSVRAEGRK